MGNASSSSKKVNQPEALLSLLRTNPEAFFGSHALLVRGSVTSGSCSLTPVQTSNASILQLDVTAGGIDWYIPFRSSSAAYIDVPKGQDTGTLVATFSMNGCALSVHETPTGNRFFHDADGKNMPGSLPDGVHPIAKFRRTDSDFSGTDLTELNEYAANVNENAKATMIDDKNFVRSSYEHTVISVKTDEGWEVYRCSVITWGQQLVWMNKNQPCLLGKFMD
ncbi:hypothetical protein ACIPIN_05475 [Pseudomonas sp. NPDC087697]|uniref:hypothetical protein n=1 Tax=Pseudomonas sp. NPDC087697 TaxID=3364447 RepID=UPI0038029960